MTKRKKITSRNLVLPSHRTSKSCFLAFTSFWAYLTTAFFRREEIRKQRIESEQRRRDELREGYRRLKDALPSSNQKSSKVSLLDRAVTHVRYMELTRQQLQVRLNAAEMETQRLRQ